MRSFYGGSNLGLLDFSFDTLTTVPHWLAYIAAFMSTFMFRKIIISEVCLQKPKYMSNKS